MRRAVPAGRLRRPAFPDVGPSPRRRRWHRVSTPESWTPAADLRPASRPRAILRVPSGARPAGAACVVMRHARRGRAARPIRRRQPVPTSITFNGSPSGRHQPGTIVELVSWPRASATGRYQSVRDIVARAGRRLLASGRRVASGARLRDSASRQSRSDRPAQSTAFSWRPARPAVPRTLPAVRGLTAACRSTPAEAAIAIGPCPDRGPPIAADRASVHATRSPAATCGGSGRSLRAQSAGRPAGCRPRRLSRRAPEPAGGPPLARDALPRA